MREREPRGAVTKTNASSCCSKLHEQSPLLQERCWSSVPIWDITISAQLSAFYEAIMLPWGHSRTQRPAVSAKQCPELKLDKFVQKATSFLCMFPLININFLLFFPFAKGNDWHITFLMRCCKSKIFLQTIKWISDFMFHKSSRRC